MKSRDGRTVLRQNYEAMYATEYTKHKNLHLTNEKLMGKTAIEKAGDLIHIILLGLAKNLPPYTEENKLHGLLGALFTNELTADEKNQYNVLVSKYLNNNFMIGYTTSFDAVDRSIFGQYDISKHMNITYSRSYDMSKYPKDWYGLEYKISF